jgi:beta-glucosidase/6-phospho-beta-glucosidase/beta-galactosidase
MEFMRSHNMAPILDPLHHTSFPAWLSDGFLHPEFPVLYVQFLRKLAQRYPWARHYTLFNEPLPTVLFCSYTGMWYPHLTSDRSFVAMLLQVGRAICLGFKALSDVIHPHLVHVETCEHHQAVDELSANWARFLNMRRFLVTDLILGRVSHTHPLYLYLLNNGATEHDLDWFVGHRARIDVLGLDYYPHSELDWHCPCDKQTFHTSSRIDHPHGFASVAKDYITRFELPIMLAETNIVGSVAERISWLKLMEEQCERLVLSGVDLRGFCWYPSIDTTDWSNGCTKYTGQIDPQGIWSLREGSFERVDTELSDIYGRLARGEIKSSDIPTQDLGVDVRKRIYRYRPVQVDTEQPCPVPIVA